MDHVNIVGLFAGAITTGSFLPQAVKIYRTRHTRDLSLSMYITLFVGVSLWLCYGLMAHSYPIIIANAVTIAITLYILAMKIKYK
ncbi:MAG: SemiSWEET transporter [Candidatus Omnitrophota bacterium]